MNSMLPIILTALGIMIFLIAVYAVIIGLFYKKVPQSKALIRTGIGGTKIALSEGIYSIPIFHELQYIDLTLKEVKIQLTEDNSLICSDDIRADIKATFTVRIGNDRMMIMRASQTLGAANTSDSKYVQNLFEAKFNEAVKTVARKFKFNDLLEKRNGFRDLTIEMIGSDLNGYLLQDAAIHYIEKSK